MGYISSIVSSNATLLSGNAYKKSFPKNPTVIIYNASTGAANSVYNASSGGSVAVSNTGGSSEQIPYITLATAQTLGQLCQYGFTADSGW